MATPVPISVPVVSIPDQFNAASAFLDGNLAAGRGAKTAVIHEGKAYTYAEIAAQANQVGNGLRALGVEEELAHTSLRIGLGRFTTEQDVDYAVEHIVESVQRLRSMSPLWEMAQEGIDIKSIQWAEH